MKNTQIRLITKQTQYNSPHKRTMPGAGYTLEERAWASDSVATRQI